ncbi:MAG: WD40 repeat domain-containing serine/threonine-protein kinase [Pirellulales bacterium]
MSDDADEKTVEQLIEPIGSLGEYALLEALSEDELTTVYLAYDDATGRYVTIRRVRPEWGVGQPVRERLLRAWQVYARLEDPNILPIHEVVASDEATYCVLPHLEGESLAERVGAGGRLRASDAAEVALGICRGVLHAHHQGVTPRRLSPDTVAVIAQPTRLRPTPILRTLLLDTAFITYSRAAVLQKELGPQAPPRWRWLKRPRRRRRATKGVTPLMEKVGAFLLFATGAGRYRWTPWSTSEFYRSLEWINRRQRRRLVPEELERVLVRCLSRESSVRYGSLESLARGLRSAAVKCRVREAQAEPTSSERLAQLWRRCQRLLHWTAYALALAMIASMSPWLLSQAFRYQPASSLVTANAPNNIRQPASPVVTGSNSSEFERDGKWSPTWEMGYHTRSRDALIQSILTAEKAPSESLAAVSSSLASDSTTPAAPRPLAGRAICEFRTWTILPRRGVATWTRDATSPIDSSVDEQLPAIERAKRSDAEIEQSWEFAMGTLLQPRWQQTTPPWLDCSMWPRVEKQLSHPASLPNTLVYRSPDGAHAAIVVNPRVIAVADARSGVRFIDVSRGEELGRIVDNELSLAALSIASDNRILATVWSDGTLGVWRWETGERLANLPSTKKFEETPRRLGGASTQAAMTLDWPLQLDLSFSIISPPELSHSDSVIAVRFLEHKSTLVSVDSRGVIHEWDTRLETRWGIQGAEPSESIAALPLRNDQLVSVGRNGLLQRFSRHRRPTCSLRLTPNHELTSATLLLPESTAATGNTKGQVEVWDLVNGRRMHIEPCHQGPIRCLTASRDGRLLATAGDEGDIKVREIGSSSPARVLGKHHGPVWRIAFSFQGNRVASAGEDGKCKMWSLDPSSSPRECVGHLGPVYAVAFSPCGRRLASGGADGTVRLWDTEDGRETLKLDIRPRTPTGIASDYSLFTVDFSPDGLSVAAGGRDGRVRMWRADPF